MSQVECVQCEPLLAPYKKRDNTHTLKRSVSSGSWFEITLACALLYSHTTTTTTTT